MAIYTYECPCGQVLEINHPMSETPDIECDNCDNMMHKVYGIAGIHFKGSAFYTTDKG